MHQNICSKQEHDDLFACNNHQHNRVCITQNEIIPKLRMKYTTDTRSCETSGMSRHKPLGADVERIDPGDVIVFFFPFLVELNYLKDHISSVPN